MIKQENVYKIGRLGKPHGIKGEIQLFFDDDIFDRTDADYLIIDIDSILVPFFIEEYRFKSEETALIKFQDIDSDEQARQLTGNDVYFPREMADHDTENVSWSEIVGYKLVNDNDDTIVGTIASIDDTTVNILFQLADGRLIPASEELITEIDKTQKTIRIIIPDGLLEI